MKDLMVTVIKHNLVNFKVMNDRSDSRERQSTRFIGVIAFCAISISVWADSDFAKSLWQPSGPGVCDGHYDVSRLVKTPSTPTNSDEVKLHADHVELDLKGTSKISGGVRVHLGDLLLATSRLEVDALDQIFSTADGMTIVNENFALHVDSTTIEAKARALQVQGADFVLLKDGYRGRAERLTASDVIAEFEEVSITYCPPEVNSWLLSAGRIRLNRAQNIAVARDVQLSLGKLPTFYVPYLRFPLSGARTTGLLPPNFERNSLRGYELALPIYVNFAPNYDLTLTPRLSSRQNHSLETEFRYLTRVSASEFNAVFLPSDDEYLDYLASRIDRTPISSVRSSRRWYIGVQHGFAFDGWVGEVDYSFVSDEDFLRDFGGSIDDLGRVGLWRTAYISKLGRDYSLMFSSERFEPFRYWGTSVSKLPQIEYRHQFPLLVFNVGFDTHMARYKSVDLVQEFDVERRHGNFFLKFPFQRSWGSVNIEGTRAYTWFGLPDENHTRHTTTFLWDSNLLFDRMHSEISASMQSLEPRLVYVRRDSGSRKLPFSFDVGPRAVTMDSILNPTRMTGYDQLPSVHAIALGLRGSLIGLDVRRKLLEVQLAVSAPLESFDYNPHKTPSFGLAVLGSLTVDLQWSAAYFRYFDLAREEANEFRIRYQLNQTRVNGWLRYEKEAATLQSYLDIAVPVARGWSVYGRWHHDWEHDAHVDSYVGLEFSGCCMEYRLLWHRTIRYEWLQSERIQSRTGLRFELSMKGLTSFGDNVLSIVNRNINSPVLVY